MSSWVPHPVQPLLKICLEPVFGKCLQSQLTILAREWLELLESHTSVVTNHDINQLGHPLVHQIWRLWDYFQKSNSTLKEKELLLLKWFPKTRSQVLGRPMCDTCWDRTHRKGGNSGLGRETCSLGSSVVGSVQQAPGWVVLGEPKGPPTNAADGWGSQWFQPDPSGQGGLALQNSFPPNMGHTH